MDSLSGRVLGHYELLELLGRGGMGAVYRARHVQLQQPRALKVLPPQLAWDETFVLRFEREARIAAGLDHPHIVPIYDIGEADGFHYIAMRLVDGISLKQFLEGNGPLAPERAVNLLKQLSAALDFAHARGVIHRDLKPANVIVGANELLTLVDFGIARAAEGARFTSTGMAVGTPEYMSPEAVSGGEPGPGVDLYALGIVAFEMLTGRVPFRGMDTPKVMFAQAYSPPPTPRSIRPELPVAVEAVLLHQLAKDPAHRYPSATSFVEAIERALLQTWELPQVAGSAPPPWTASPVQGPDRTGEPFQVRPVQSPFVQAPAAPVRAAPVPRRSGHLPLVLAAGLPAGLGTAAVIVISVLLMGALGSLTSQPRWLGPLFQFIALSQSTDFWLAALLVTLNEDVMNGPIGVGSILLLQLVLGAIVGMLFAALVRWRSLGQCALAGTILNLLVWVIGASLSTLEFFTRWGAFDFEDHSNVVIGLGLPLGLVLSAAFGALLGLTYCLFRNGLARVFLRRTAG